MINWDIASVLTAAVAAVISGVAALRGARSSWKLGVQGNELAARRDEAQIQRDTLEDRDRLIDQLQEQAVEIQARVAILEESRDRWQQLYYREVEYSRVLIDHIYRQAPPPPPGRVV